MLDVKVVLDIALASGATNSDQLIGALSVAGLKIVPSDTQCGLGEIGAQPSVIDDPVAFVQEIADRREISTTELARRVGLAPSTLNKAVKDPTGFGMLSVRTLKKIKDWDSSTAVIDDPHTFVLDVLERHKISPGGLATQAGIAPSTLTRALNDPNHKFKFSLGTLLKIKEWDHKQAQGA